MNDSGGLQQKLLNSLPILLPGLAAGAALIFGALPLSRQILLERGEFSESRRINADLDAKIRTLQSLSKRDLSDTLIKLELLLPSQTRTAVPFLLTNLENLTAADSLKVVNLSFAGSETLGGESIQLSFSVQGNAAKLVQFLGELKKLVPLVEIVSLKASAIEGNSEKLMVLGVSLPLAPLPETVGKVEEPLANLSATQEKLLQTLSEYRFPEAADYSVMSSNLPAGKENPF